MPINFNLKYIRKIWNAPLKCLTWTFSFGTRSILLSNRTSLFPASTICLSTAWSREPSGSRASSTYQYLRYKRLIGKKLDRCGNIKNVTSITTSAFSIVFLTSPANCLIVLSDRPAPFSIKGTRISWTNPWTFFCVDIFVYFSMYIF